MQQSAQGGEPRRQTISPRKSDGLERMPFEASKEILCSLENLPMMLPAGHSLTRLNLATNLGESQKMSHHEFTARWRSSNVNSASMRYDCVEEDEDDQSSQVLDYLEVGSESAKENLRRDSLLLLGLDNIQ